MLMWLYTYIISCHNTSRITSNQFQLHTKPPKSISLFCLKWSNSLQTYSLCMFKIIYIKWKCMNKVLKEKLYDILYMYIFVPASLGTDIWAFMIDLSQIQLANITSEYQERKVNKRIVFSCFQTKYQISIFRQEKLH
jgi:hypothetical protein